MPSLTGRPFLSTVATLILSVGLVVFPLVSQAAIAPSTTFQAFQPDDNMFASAIVMDSATKKVLYEYNADKPHTAASLTKLANALAFLKLSIDWNALVSIKPVDEVGGGRLRVAVGSKMTVQDLVYSAIVGSANNAAMAMARVTGLSMKSYLAKMNKAAKDAGATHSVFYDAAGMNSKNMTTARDIALLARAAFGQRAIQKAASTAKYSFAVKTPSKSNVTHTIKNTDALLTQDDDVYVIGGKTGYLEESMYNLAVQLRPFNADGTPNRQKDLIVVVMGAPTQAGSFSAAKTLAQWAWNNHEFNAITKPVPAKK